MAETFFNPHAASVFSPDKLNRINLYESPHMFCDVYCLQPGHEQAPHTHPGNDKVYYVMSGACEITIGAETRLLTPGQLAIAPSGVVHGARNTSDADASLLVVMAPHPTLKG